MKTLLYTLACACLIANLHPAAGAVATNTAKHLTLDESLAIALQQNPAILQAQQEIKASRGLIVEVRAAALPQVRANGQYERIEPANVLSIGFLRQIGDYLAYLRGQFTLPVALLDRPPSPSSPRHPAARSIPLPISPKRW
jgi:outer membrane protein TolC